MYMYSVNIRHKLFIINVKNLFSFGTLFHAMSLMRINYVPTGESVQCVAVIIACALVAEDPRFLLLGTLRCPKEARLME
jgi:hypothetical protein